MTQKEKQLLLKDICSRLPYTVNIQIKEGITIDTELKTGHIQRLQNNEIGLKPYLRSMSSMTEDEEDELNSARMGNYGEDVDWLNANHFDYRGLIEKGLALEAHEEMYKND